MFGITFSLLASDSSSSWFLSNLWWIILSAVVVVAAVVVLIVLLTKKGKKTPKVKRHVVVTSEYFGAMGGEANILSHQRKGSRIELRLKDYQSIDKAKLKEAGVDSFILMSDKLILVIQGDAEAVEKALFPQG